MKKVVVSIVGFALVVGGIALLVLPGPGIIVVVAGLGVLATQYDWARELFAKGKEKAAEAQHEAVQSVPRIALTVGTACVTAALGVAMSVVDDVPWPWWDSVGDAVWTPVTGGVLIGTSVLVLVTTAIAWRQEHSRTPSQRA